MNLAQILLGVLSFAPALDQIVFDVQSIISNVTQDVGGLNILKTVLTGLQQIESVIQNAIENHPENSTN